MSGSELLLGSRGFVPRVFQDATDADKHAVQSCIAGIDMYPLAEFDGTMKQHDWRTIPTLKSPGDDAGEGETKWVFPEKFFDELPLVLFDAPPLRGEEGRYAEVLAVIAAAKREPALMKAIVDEAAKTDWLPAPRGDFSLYIRAYRPEPATTSGQWEPPVVQRLT